LHVVGRSEKIASSFAESFDAAYDILLHILTRSGKGLLQIHSSHEGQTVTVLGFYRFPIGRSQRLEWIEDVDSAVDQIPYD
jgi:hypothetical protein